MRIALVHPDLGLGGAERLVIDVALALKSRGHAPSIYTAHRDPSRCFADVAPGEEAFPVRVVPTPIPRSVLGRFQALLAALRCASVALWLCIAGGGCDVAVVDIVSLPVVVFLLFRIPVVFYCHFPDKTLEQTLRTKPSSPLRRAYRAVIDGLEQAALSQASIVLCNSRFTRDVFCATYPQLNEPQIVYPCVKIPEAEPRKPASHGRANNVTELTFVSLNRYERKKNIPLAVRALKVARERLDCVGRLSSARIKLIIAGGYDERLAENVEHFTEIENLVVECGLQEHIELRRNVSDADRRQMISNALAVIYTPQNEHFGIVPLEAMALGTPVVAANSGGPTETVVEGECGYLCEPREEDFGAAMTELAIDPAHAQALGLNGAQRVRDQFSLTSLADSFEPILQTCVKR